MALKAPTQVWADPETNQTCFVSKNDAGADLELRLYGFRVHRFAFPSLTEALRWANQWRPEGSPEIDAPREGGPTIR